MVTKVERIGGTRLLKVHKDLVDMKTGEAFKAALMDLYSDGETVIILDFKEINRINSHGIGKILMFYKKFRETGGQIFLAPLEGPVKEIFDTLMIDKLIPKISSLA